jgi:Uma2 family endonuclease
MDMAVKAHVVTADELLRMPDENGVTHELVYGRVLKVPLPGWFHGWLAGRWYALINQHVQANHLGLVFSQDTGFKLTSNPDTVRGPDVGYVTRERAAGARPLSGYWLKAPDLVVEIRSPNDRRSRVRAKAEEWLAHGTRTFWDVEPERMVITAHHADGTKRLFTAHNVISDEKLLPGFQHLVRDLLALPELKQRA